MWIRKVWRYKCNAIFFVSVNSFLLFLRAHSRSYTTHSLPCMQTFKDKTFNLKKLQIYVSFLTYLGSQLKPFHLEQCTRIIFQYELSCYACVTFFSLCVYTYTQRKRDRVPGRQAVKKQSIIPSVNFQLKNKTNVLA